MVGPVVLRRWRRQQPRWGRRFWRRRRRTYHRGTVARLAVLAAIQAGWRAGLGAIFVRAGSLTLMSTTFTNDSATGERRGSNARPRQSWGHFYHDGHARRCRYAVQSLRIIRPGRRDHCNDNDNTLAILRSPQLLTFGQCSRYSHAGASFNLTVTASINSTIQLRTMLAGPFHQQRRAAVLPADATLTNGTGVQHHAQNGWQPDHYGSGYANSPSQGPTMPSPSVRRPRVFHGDCARQRHGRHSFQHHGDHSALHFTATRCAAG